MCETFVKMAPNERVSRLEAKNLCTKCLYPGATVGPKHKCFYANFCCPNASHNEKLHIVLCGAHKNEESSKKVMSRFIISYKVPLSQHTKNISCFSEMISISKTIGKSLNVFNDFSIDPEIPDSAIFQLQAVEVNGVKLDLSFGSGCGDLIVKNCI